jgi:hypothetical protein
MSDSVCRYLKTILDEGNEPANQYHQNERRFLELQMAIPSEGHENVRN